MPSSHPISLWSVLNHPEKLNRDIPFSGVSLICVPCFHLLLCHLPPHSLPRISVHVFVVIFNIFDYTYVYSSHGLCLLLEYFMFLGPRMNDISGRKVRGIISNVT